MTINLSYRGKIDYLYYKYKYNKTLSDENIDIK